MKTLTSKPTLINVVEALREDIFSNLNCHAIGKIQEFDPSTQLATVSIEYNRAVENNEDTYERVDYPNLSGVPVLFNKCFRYPIKTGDYCILLFNDRDIDNWVSTRSKTRLASERKHSFSDAIAIVGLSPIDDFSSNRVEMVNGSTKISMNEKIKIMNASADLFSILNGVLDILSTLTTTNCVVGSPVAISPAQATQIISYKAQLALLLE